MSAPGPSNSDYASANTLSALNFVLQLHRTYSRLHTRNPSLTTLSTPALAAALVATTFSNDQATTARIKATTAERRTPSTPRLLPHTFWLPVADAAYGLSHAQFTEKCGIPADDILLSRPDPASAPFTPCFFIAQHSYAGEPGVVLTIRGTKSAVDVLTNLECDSESFLADWGGRGVWPGGIPARDSYGHRGVVRSAAALFQELKNVLPELVEQFGKLTVVGHSLGGAVAQCFVALLLANVAASDAGAAGMERGTVGVAGVAGVAEAAEAPPWYMAGGRIGGGGGGGGDAEPMRDFGLLRAAASVPALPVASAGPGALMKPSRGRALLRETRCFAYAPPPCLSPALAAAPAVRAAISAVFVGADVVPSLSAEAVDELMFELVGNSSVEGFAKSIWSMVVGSAAAAPAARRPSAVLPNDPDAPKPMRLAGTLVHLDHAGEDLPVVVREVRAEDMRFLRPSMSMLSDHNTKTIKAVLWRAVAQQESGGEG